MAKIGPVIKLMTFMKDVLLMYHYKLQHGWLKTGLLQYLKLPLLPSCSPLFRHKSILNWWFIDGLQILASLNHTLMWCRNRQLWAALLYFSKLPTLKQELANGMAEKQTRNGEERPWFAFEFCAVHGLSNKPWFIVMCGCIQWMSTVEKCSEWIYGIFTHPPTTQ